MRRSVNREFAQSGESEPGFLVMGISGLGQDQTNPWYQLPRRPPSEIGCVTNA